MERKNKTITIKINGANHPFKDEVTEDEKSDFSKNSQEIAETESAVSQEQAEDEFEWILPEPIQHKEITEYTIHKGTAKKSKKKDVRFYLKKFKTSVVSTILLIVLFAVLLGTGFGMVVLKFVNVTPDAVPVSGAAGNTPPKAAGEGTEAPLSLINTFVVQGGVYTTEELAKEARDATASKGVPAKLFKIEEKTALFLGTADTLENAKLLAASIANKGVEVFPKPIGIGAGTLKGLQAAEAEALKKMPGLFADLTAASSQLASSGSMANGLAGKIEKQVAELKAVEKSGMTNSQVQTMTTHLHSTSEAIVSFEKTKDKKQLDKMQAELVSFLAVYHNQ
ncbi:hypothetical protein [Mesobacillus harenae]|uniref:hypothetical protein n=1 Tax=Mesobacillus harenae TaxID=2213203 RepID=UPI00158014FA|nr:hypothetical protein [Mesobacillus harenae]